MKHATELLPPPATAKSADPLPIDPVARKAALIASIDPWLRGKAIAYCQSFGLGPGNADEIFAIGRELAMRIADTFDEARGAKFLSYVSRYVTWRMRGAAMALKLPMHVPEYCRFHRGIAFSVPLDAPASDFSGSGESSDATIGEIIRDETATDPADRAEITDRLDVLERALAILTTREREVMQKRFWQDRSLEDIGTDYGLTRERIRQIERRALLRIRGYFARTEQGAEE